MAFRSSSQLTGTSGTSAAIPVPAGAASGDIAVVGLYLESTATVTGVPSGFTQKADLQTSATARGRLVVYWKRLTGADTGTYTFSWSGSTWRAGVCGLWSGRVASGDPFDGTVGTAESTTSVSSLTTSTSPAGSNGDAVGLWTDFSGGNGWTPPTNYTERQDIDLATLITRDAVASGSTGSISPTASISGFMKAFLGVLAVAGGGGASVTGTAVSSLPGPTATATGIRTVGATAVASLPGPTATASGGRTIAGTAVAGLPTLTASMAGGRTVVATAVANLPAVTAGLAGVRSTMGSALASLPGPTATINVNPIGPSVSTYDGRGLKYHLNRKAGTLVGDQPTVEAQRAANIWAGTTGLDLVGALNARAGNTTLTTKKELAGVLNQLASTTNLEVDEAAARIP